MSLTRALIYKSKSLFESPLGGQVTRLGKYLAGLYFDVVLRTYRTEGMQFFIPADHTTREMRGKFTVDTYELPERTLAKRHLPPDSVVLELGGCIGVVSCTINRLLKSPERHVVLEANPHLISTISKNRDVNHCKFSVRNTAISQSETITISTSSTMDSNRIAADSQSSTDSVTVRTTSIAEIEAETGFRFNAVVMDIEGAEYDFIMENRSTFKRVDSLLVEMHPSIVGQKKLAEMEGVLSGAGLRKIDSLLTVEFWTRLAP